jgi:hypothetical protein
MGITQPQNGTGQGRIPVCGRPSWEQADCKTLRFLYPAAPNKANLPRFWAGNEGGVENKANLGGRGSDWGLGIAGWGFADVGHGRRAGPVRQTNPISVVFRLRMRIVLENKANPRLGDCHVASLLAMTAASGEIVVPARPSPGPALLLATTTAGRWRELGLPSGWGSPYNVSHDRAEPVGTPGNLRV